MVDKFTPTVTIHKKYVDPKSGFMVHATLDLDDGMRVGALPVQLQPTASDDAIAKACLAAYGVDG
jgi:hypothetical protein